MQGGLNILKLLILVVSVSALSNCQLTTPYVDGAGFSFEVQLGFFDDAEELCRNNNRTLARISNSQQFDTVKSLIDNNPGIFGADLWIGNLNSRFRP